MQDTTNSRDAGVPVGMYRDRRGRLQWRIGNTPSQRAYYSSLRANAFGRAGDPRCAVCRRVHDKAVRCSQVSS